MFNDVQEFRSYSEKQLRQAAFLLDSLIKEDVTRDTAQKLSTYNELSICIDNVAALSSLLSNVHPNEEIRAAAEEAEQEVSNFATELSLNKDFYHFFSVLGVSELDDTAKRLVEKTLRDFQRSGVDKPEDVREQIKILNQELVQIGQEFERNIREGVRSIELTPAELDGLPEDYKKIHLPDENGNIRITTDYPDYEPFIIYAKNHKKRRELQFEFKNRAYPKNIPVLKKLLQKRYELANLLGFSNWADCVTEDKMIMSGAAVEVFIDDLKRMADPVAKKEYAMLLQEKRKDFHDAVEIEDSEASFYKEKLRQSMFDFDSQEVREYFEYTTVKQGLLGLTSQLFSVQYEPVVGVETWHESVEVYEVFANGEKLGRIYFDMHPRKNKYTHAAQFTLKSGVKGVQLPEGVLVCNFPSPVDSPEGALLDHGQVVTFFHEFGHLLHHIFAGAETWVDFSGTATEWDFVEAPSQMFEEWAWNPETLEQFARHYCTGEVLPRVLVNKMRAAHEFGKGLFVRQQLLYTAMSLQYYSRDPATFDASELAQELQSVYGLYPYMERTHFEASFGHLEGYSALYYTYLWSLVIAKDLLSRFQKEGMLNPMVATDYRQKILARGGAKPAAELIQDFLGRPYSFDPFRLWLEGVS